MTTRAVSRSGTGGCQTRKYLALRPLASPGRRWCGGVRTAVTESDSVVAAATTDEKNSVSAALEIVRAKINAAAGDQPPPRLVAVGKTKPVELLKEAYDAGQRDFGENYAQELVGKAPVLPDDVRWHFIGALQSNKCKMLITKVPNLAMVETVKSVKVANGLNKACEAIGREPLSVMVQVNTSGEESKAGVEPEKATELAIHVARECTHLRLAGLMTIGMPDYTSRPENFTCLLDCRAAVAKELGVDPETLELSMGMSGDFEAAIAMGSTNVRVGSTIFGAREYPNAQK